MNNDPRYLPAPDVQHAVPANLVRPQRGWFDATIVFLLVIPVVLLSAMAWQLLSDNQTSVDSASQVATESLTGENRVLREMLQTMVAADGGNDALVENYTELSFNNRMLQANLEGQLARVDAAEAAYVEAEAVVAELKASKLADDQTIAGLSDQVRRLRESNEQFSTNGGVIVPPDAAGGYLWTLLIGVVASVGGVLLGMLFSKPTHAKRTVLVSETEGVGIKDNSMEALV